MPRKTGTELRCNQCGHEWKQSAKGPPVRCGNCSTRDWNKPKWRSFDEHWTEVHNAALNVQIS